MINLALLQSRDEFNEFTQSLADRAATTGPVEVELRNGFKVKVQFENQVDNYASVNRFFRTAGWEFVWNLDGSNTESDCYDIIEFN